MFALQLMGARVRVRRFAARLRGLASGLALAVSPFYRATYGGKTLVLI
jgi:hypothetical protein